MTAVDIRVEREEVESLVIALRALYAERQTLMKFGLHSGALSVAIDDLDQILARVRAVEGHRLVPVPHPVELPDNVTGWSRRVEIEVVS
jgi:hypothetical protein